MDTCKPAPLVLLLTLLALLQLPTAAPAQPAPPPARVMFAAQPDPDKASISAIDTMMPSLRDLGFVQDERPKYFTCEEPRREIVSGTIPLEGIVKVRSFVDGASGRLRMYHNPVVRPNYPNPCGRRPHDLGEHQVRKAAYLDQQGLAHGKDVIVAIVDRGIDMTPISRSFRKVKVNAAYSWPKTATPIVGKHGTLCAYVAAMAAPEIELADVRVTGDARSFSEAYQHLHDTWKNETAKKALIVSTSWSFRARRDFTSRETLEAQDHPLRSSVLCLVKAGVDVVFPAGNTGKCESASRGQGGSITPPNAMKEAMTLAAVDGQKMRLGDSGQGGGGALTKPDISAYASLVLNRMEVGRHTSVATAFAAGILASLRSLDGWAQKERPFALARKCFEAHADKTVTEIVGTTAVQRRLTAHSLDYGNGVMRFDGDVLKWKTGCGIIATPPPTP